MVTIASRSFIARSKSLSSVATFTRLIRRLQVSLSDDIQIAQMRSSMALALASSGAILSAPNSVSRLYVEPPRPLGGVVEGDGQVRGVCADAGETAAIPKAAATTRTGNRELMPLNLFPHSRAASGKTETKLRRPVKTSR